MLTSDREWLNYVNQLIDNHNPDYPLGHFLSGGNQFTDELMLRFPPLSTLGEVREILEYRLSVASGGHI